MIDGMSSLRLRRAIRSMLVSGVTGSERSPTTSRVGAGANAVCDITGTDSAANTILPWMNTGARNWRDWIAGAVPLPMAGRRSSVVAVLVAARRRWSAAQRLLEQRLVRLQLSGR